MLRGGRTLTSAPVSIKNCCLVLESVTKNKRLWCETPGDWAASRIDRRWSLTMVMFVERTSRVESISWRRCQTWYGTSTLEVGYVVHWRWYHYEGKAMVNGGWVTDCDLLVGCGDKDGWSDQNGGC